MTANSIEFPPAALAKENAGEIRLANCIRDAQNRIAAIN